ncbi:MULTISPECIES: hypothetical protein [Actinomycetes]|uniref:Ribbon-helix-helix protein, CopG family n=2 Tax=Actinomycetes TaxID=1760 RepID=A0ABP6LS82_9MICC|nr:MULTISPECIES: hypothetical protein [unclassified Nesterenkonia]MDS2172727.1 CopG family transcriptional regulator [Nesterenkonia sp. CL21]OSM43802.1 hypothetical protein BCY76_006225 [Nesterenkonia sp. PF2B19]
MKTAISVPDGTFERAERVALRHGMNRSQFYAKAAERYADELDAHDTTATIDSVVDVVNADESARFAVASGHRMADGDDEW